MGFYTDEKSVYRAAKRFSRKFDIVKSTDVNGKKVFANAIEENGLDGGVPTKRSRMSYKRAGKKISEALRGRKPSKASVRKMILSLTGRPLSEEHKKNISKGLNKPSAKKALREASLGKKQSTETVEKRREKLLGQKRSEEFKLLQRAKVVSKETRKRISRALKGRTISKERRQKLSEANKGKFPSDEIRRKLQGMVVVIYSFILKGKSAMQCSGIGLCGNCAVPCITYKLIVGKTGDGLIARPRNWWQRIAGLMLQLDHTNRQHYNTCIMPLFMEDQTRAVRISSKLEKGLPEIYKQCFIIADMMDLHIMDCPTEYLPQV